MSSSPLLFELVLRLKKMEMEHNIIIHVVHVSGKRMIDQGTDQGTDGLSRSIHWAGVVTGRDIRDWVPLHQGALVMSQGLTTWINRVTSGLGFTTLEPEGWFTSGTFGVNADDWPRAGESGARPVLSHWAGRSSPSPCSMTMKGNPSRRKLKRSGFWKHGREII
jgi:hypothetical protein